MLENIPAELREYPNFVLWRYEDRDSIKPTKVPYDAKTGNLASVANSETWSTFEYCMSILPHVPMDGIGFVLSEDCPFTCIDLDATDDPDMIHKQKGIAAAFNSYSEISPSGKGLHIWIRGKVESGRRRGAVEVYSSGRYMTMTGRTFNAIPIQNCNELLQILWAEMEVAERTPSILGKTLNREQTVDDLEVLKIASSAVNSEKFIDLYEGRWEKYYPSQSEADFAIIDILGYYTQNREQIARIFRNCELGKRKKAHRFTYVDGMISRSFDKQPEPIDLDSLKNKFEAQLECAKKKPADTKETLKRKKRYKPIPAPSGLIGEIARFVYEAAPRQVPEIALAASLGLMAGICGRAYNISGTGLNQYLLLLAPTGTGKESAGSGIGKLMNQVMKTIPGAISFVGPGEIASPQALIKYMDKTSTSFLSLVGEFGLMLKQISSARANSNQIGLRRALLDLYNKSGNSDSFKPMIYSDRDKNTAPVLAPALTILGESTPERFYETLTDDMIYEGLLPRFLTIEYLGKRPQLNKNHTKAVPGSQLIESLAQLSAHALQLNGTNTAVPVLLNESSEVIFQRFDEKCDGFLNAAGSELVRHLWNRAHIKALKLAGLVAVGNNYINPVIDDESALWAIDVVERDIHNLLDRYESGDIGQPSGQNEQLVDIRKAFHRYLFGRWEDVASYPGATHATHYNKVVPHSFIGCYCRSRASFKDDRIGPLDAIKKQLQAMIEEGEIQEMSPIDKIKAKLPKAGKIYVHLKVETLDS